MGMALGSRPAIVAKSVTRDHSPVQYRRNEPGINSLPVNRPDPKPLFTRSEEHELRQTIAVGAPPQCPRCGVCLLSQRVEPRPDVAYVRRRTWWFCRDCRRGLVVDRRD
jgi:hypothetical protein